MKVLFFFAATLVFASCTAQPTEADKTTELAKPLGAIYGDTITTDGAMPIDKLYASLGDQDSLHTKVQATINESCKVKGCWMTVAMADGKEMRVRFKDYGFFVPTSGLNGKTAIMEGVAFTDTLSVDHLKHLAEDAGKSEEEIAAIDTPEVGVNFEATGVIILD